MLPHSFKEGFAEGFAAPLSLIILPHTPEEKYKTSVGDAWNQVGRAFKIVLKKERTALGKVSGKKVRSGTGRKKRGP